MVYGIDLGTTNSLIGSGDELYSGLVSSSVDIKKREQVSRDKVSEDIISSYKTNMSVGADGKLPVECSSVILKKLAQLASDKTDENVKDVVISVPAYFSTSQREAVYKAAHKAGLNVKCLINEPTAAAIYVCRNMKDLVVVFDLGGGTFDITIVDSRLGNYSVLATDGKVLGGDDLDDALCNEVISKCKVPIRYRSNERMKVLKARVRLAKEEIQRTQQTVKIDMSDFGITGSYDLTEEIYKQMVADVFHDTIVRTYYLIHNNIPINEKPKLVFVGGSTACPYLRKMVKDAIEIDVVECPTKPDFIVAKGTALYAKMIEEGTAMEMVEDVTKRLCIEDKLGNSITIIESNSIVPAVGSIIVSNSTRGNKMDIKLYQGDSYVACKNAYIGTLIYDYGREVEEGEGLVEIITNVSHDGVISLKAYEVLFGESSMQEISLTAR